MDRPQQVLVLLQRSPRFWDACRSWLEPSLSIVDSARQLDIELPPVAVVLEHHGAELELGWVEAPGDDGTSVLGKLDHPDLPWSCRHWVQDEATRLILLTHQPGPFRSTRDALWLPHDASPRELALALTEARAQLDLRRARKVERHRGERYARFALRDPLTGLSNRRAWQLYLRRHLMEVEEGQSLCLALVDIDLFKQVNSAFGHATADQVLRQVGRSLREELRVTDLAARLGGDEFGIALNPSPKGSAADVLHRVRRRIREQLIQNHLPAVTVTIGYTELPIARNDSARQALRRAAEALQWAKTHQRNTVVGCDPRWPASAHLA